MGFFGDPLYTPAYEVAGDELAVFDTSKGVIRVRLDGEGAPVHVANFCELAESGFSTPWAPPAPSFGFTSESWLEISCEEAAYATVAKGAPPAKRPESATAPKARATLWVRVMCI